MSRRGDPSLYTASPDNFMGYTSVEIDAMTPADRIKRQDEIARAYLVRADARMLADMAVRAMPVEADPVERWTNGPCVYCGKNDGFTEVRSVGPVHLARCFASHTVVQRRKELVCRSRS